LVWAIGFMAAPGSGHRSSAEGLLSNLRSLLETGSIAMADPYPGGKPYRKTQKAQ